MIDDAGRATISNERLVLLGGMPLRRTAFLEPTRHIRHATSGEINQENFVLLLNANQMYDSSSPGAVSRGSWRESTDSLLSAASCCQTGGCGFLMIYHHPQDRFAQKSTSHEDRRKL